MLADAVGEKGRGSASEGWPQDSQESLTKEREEAFPEPGQSANPVNGRGGGMQLAGPFPQDLEGPPSPQMADTGGFQALPSRSQETPNAPEKKRGLFPGPFPEATGLEKVKVPIQPLEGEPLGKGLIKVTLPAAGSVQKGHLKRSSYRKDLPCGTARVEREEIAHIEEEFRRATVLPLKSLKEHGKTIFQGIN